MKKKAFDLLTFIILPLIALVTATGVLYEYNNKLGQVIKVEFDSAEGIKVGSTELKYNGISVGKVVEVVPTSDLRGAIIAIQLEKNAFHIATKGSKFWIVRPKANISNFENIETLISGDYIAVELSQKALMGDYRDKQTYFHGKKEKPIIVNKNSSLDLQIKVKMPYLISSTRSGSGVYYKGVKVGTVDAVHISRDANSVICTCTIKDDSAHLVRNNSIFWDMKSIELKWGLTKGLNIKNTFNPLQTAIEGGLLFATPCCGKTVMNGYEFTAQNEFNEEWLNWAPNLKVEPIKN